MKTKFWKSLALMLVALSVLFVFTSCPNGPKDVISYKTYTVNGVSFKMASIPAKGSEIPAFLIGETEVTQELWNAVMGGSNNLSNFTGDDKLPVENLSYLECLAFCNTLTVTILGKNECVYYVAHDGSLYGLGNATARLEAVKKDGKKGFRLPSLAEWEHAAKGGKNYKYSGSNNVDEVAWYAGNSENKTHPVGTKKSNDYGVYDMSGNVWEFCYDGYNARFRGACWKDNIGSCELDKIDSGDFSKIENVGFRLVIVP